MSSNSPYEKKRVCIIDDDIDFAESLSDILELHEYENLVIKNIASYQDELLSFKPHVCLIDIRLGNANGIDLIRKVKDSLPQTLCVMITAYAQIETAVTALKNGAYDYLRKPISGDELVSTLNRCFDKLQLEFDKDLAETTIKIRNKELEEANARLRTIVDSNKRIANCADMNEFGPRLLEEFARNLSAKGGSFFIKKDNAFVLLHSIDSDHAPRKLDIPLRKGSILQKVLLNRHPVVINDIDSIAEVHKSGWSGYSNPSLISFPILDHTGDVIGLISLHNKQKPPFTKHDLDFGLLIASYTAESLTALQATEKALKGEERYRCLVETMTDGLIVLNDDFYITYSNDRFCHIVGYSREELAEKPIIEFMDDSTRLNFCKLFKKRDSDTAESYEVIWMQKDGSKRASLISPQSFPVLGSDIDEDYCFAVVTDITQRKLSEEALQREKHHSDIRVKELDCLFAISSMVDKTDYTIDEILSNTVAIIPKAFQHPHIACAKIHVFDKDYCTQLCDVVKRCDSRHALAEEKYVLHSPIMGHGEKIGYIEVWYHEHLNNTGEAPYLKEEQRLLNATAELLGSIIERKRSETELKDSLETLQTVMEGIIQAMAMTTEMRDPYTAGHQRRVAKLASVIATAMGLDQDQVDGIRLAGIIHDLGKIYVPAEILTKPGHISDIELSIIRTHPQVGHDILKTIAFPWPIAQMVQQHHERLDGTGYPLGLSGEDILLGARILSVADTVEAMASHRPYRPSLGIDAALEEINKHSGSHYDPQAVDICTELFKTKKFEF
jgi:PAS domain S-box-containing protein/putative nucleotidyltransferase with HDIG domain